MLKATLLALIAVGANGKPARERVAPLNPVTQAGNPQQQHSTDEEGWFSRCEERISAHSYSYKDVAGPPSEFAKMAQPDEASLAAYSGHFATQFSHAPPDTASASVSYKQDVVVDSVSGFAIAAFTTDSTSSFTLTDAAGKEVDLSKAQTQVRANPGNANCPTVVDVMPKFLYLPPTKFARLLSSFLPFPSLLNMEYTPFRCTPALQWCCYHDHQLPPPQPFVMVGLAMVVRFRDSSFCVTCSQGLVGAPSVCARALDGACVHTRSYVLLYCKCCVRCSGLVFDIGH